MSRIVPVIALVLMFALGYVLGKEDQTRHCVDIANVVEVE